MQNSGIRVIVNPNTGLKRYEIPWNKLDEIVVYDNEGGTFFHLEKMSYQHYWLGLPNCSMDIKLNSKNKWEASLQ